MIIVTWYYVRMKKMMIAITLVMLLSGCDNETYEALIAKGLEYRNTSYEAGDESGNFSRRIKAIEEFSKAIKLEPYVPFSYKLRAWTYMDLASSTGNKEYLQLSVADLTTAIETTTIQLYPDIQYYHSRAVSSFYLEQFDDFEADIEEICSIIINDPSEYRHYNYSNFEDCMKEELVAPSSRATAKMPLPTGWSGPYPQK